MDGNVRMSWTVYDWMKNDFANETIPVPLYANLAAVEML